jgi:ferredoxin-NADP reductase/Na+-translocating ferredoxin:NAD+ oxidoreductase RnfD subunit
MIKPIDDILDRVTMYRLALYYLLTLLAAAFGFAFAGKLPVAPFDLAISTALVMIVTWATNAIFARVFAVPESRDSVWITALIVVLIMSPAAPGDFEAFGALVFAAVWSMAGKYVFAIGGRHVFNPAALAVGLTALLLDQPPTWWVAGNAALLPFVVIGGVLIVRKLRRGDLVASALLAAAAVVLLSAPLADAWPSLVNTVVYSPLLFVVFVMLTEPATTPPNRRERIVYGAIVGVLLVPTIHIASVYFTPEAALLIGNVFAYLVSPKRRLALTLRRIERSAATAHDFVFGSDRPIAFAPGQYLEFALGLARGDSRGNRRYFTIASAPTEADVRLGVKFATDPSAFKEALGAMKPGDRIFASGLAGDFVLPRSRETKLAFLAGGIGITPFRSMLRYLLDRRESRPIVMLYAADSADDFAYRDVIARADSELGIRTAFAVLRDADRLPGAHRGFIDEAMVTREIPDYAERTFYVSGPRAMVVASEALLRRLGIPHAQIKLDFFPGFA